MVARNKKPDPELVAALEYERNGYLLYGETDRAAEVDKVLEELGAKPAAKPRSPRSKSTN